MWTECKLLRIQIYHTYLHILRNTSCIREPKVIWGRGGGNPCTLPLDPPCFCNWCLVGEVVWNLGPVHKNTRRISQIASLSHQKKKRKSKQTKTLESGSKKSGLGEWVEWLVLCGQRTDSCQKIWGFKKIWVSVDGTLRAGMLLVNLSVVDGYIYQLRDVRL